MGRFFSEELISLVRPAGVSPRLVGEGLVDSRLFSTRLTMYFGLGWLDDYALRAFAELSDFPISEP